MAQYEADKIIHLLQFCCWKLKCPMDSKGFQELYEKIDSTKDSNVKIGSRYFSDLLSEANIVVKTDNLIGRKPEYIDLLLEFAGFNDWRCWENHLVRASEYAQATELDLSSVSSMESGICFPGSLDKQIYPYLTFVKKDATYPLQLLECKEKEITGQLNFVKEQLNEFPFIIWAIPLAWKDQLPLLKDLSWEDLMQSRRIVPVWIDESSRWDDKPLVVPWLTHRQTISGIPGLFGALLYLQKAIQKYLLPLNDKTKDSHSFSRVQNFQQSRGTFLLGDVQIKSENTALGDIHQTIHNHKNKES